MPGRTCGPAQAHRQISDIAYSWGFGDVSHFGRLFKAMISMTPVIIEAQSHFSLTEFEEISANVTAERNLSPQSEFASTLPQGPPIFCVCSARGLLSSKFGTMRLDVFGAGARSVRSKLARVHLGRATGIVSSRIGASIQGGDQGRCRGHSFFDDASTRIAFFASSCCPCLSPTAFTSSAPAVWGRQEIELRARSDFAPIAPTKCPTPRHARNRVSHPQVKRPTARGQIWPSKCVCPRSPNTTGRIRHCRHKWTPADRAGFSQAGTAG